MFPLFISCSISTPILFPFPPFKCPLLFNIPLFPSSVFVMSSSSDWKSLIHRRLIESGEKERLREHLRARLIECGWRDQMKLEAKEVVRQKGLERVQLEDIVREITPKGRATVPDAVKRELLTKIKEYLAQQQNL